MILEKLISLSLSLFFIAFSTELLYSVKNQFLQVKEKASEARKITQISSLIEKTLQDLDHHRLPLPLRISKGESLLFQDGTQVPISEELSPHPESSVLTGIRVNLSDVLYRESRSSFCDTRSDLHGITFSGSDFYEVILHPPSREDCEQISISTPKQSMLFSQPELSESFTPSLIIPIRSLFSLYVSRDLTLRLIRYRGGEVIENQPIMNQVPLLHFEVSEVRGILNIVVELTNPQGEELKILSLTNSLSRLSSETALFQSIRRIQ